MKKAFTTPFKFGIALLLAPLYFFRVQNRHSIKIQLQIRRIIITTIIIPVIRQTQPHIPWFGLMSLTALLSTPLNGGL